MLTAALCAACAPPHADDGVADPPWVPTPPAAVERMLTLAELEPGDTLYDLGSGDGRIVVAAARDYGVRAVGIDHDPAMIALSEAAAAEADVSHLTEFRREELLAADFSEADAVTAYLLPGMMQALRPLLEAQLPPGTPVIVHAFEIRGWEPDHYETMDSAPGRRSNLFVYRVPDTGQRGGRSGAAEYTGEPGTTDLEDNR